jgi:hypothetical protein
MLMHVLIVLPTAMPKPGPAGRDERQQLPQAQQPAAAVRICGASRTTRIGPTRMPGSVLPSSGTGSSEACSG